MMVKSSPMPLMPAWRRYWRLETGVFLAVWLALLLVGRTELFRDPGTFWHTVTGQTILQTRHVPAADQFSFSVRGKPWIECQWLADCAMAIMYRAGGWDALLLASATLLAAIYAGLAARLARAGLRPMPIMLITALALAASSHQFHVRPLLATIALLAWSFALVVDVEAGRKPLYRLWWLVPVFVLWGNLHGGVLAGLGTVGLTAGGWCLAWLLRRESPIRNRRDALAMAAILAALALSTLINPYGLEMPRAWLSVLRMPLFEIIEEHAPLDLSQGYGRCVALLAAGYVVALLATRPKSVRATWLVPLAWALLALTRVRNAPLLAVTAVVALGEIIPQMRWPAWLRRRGILATEGRPASGGVWLVPTVLVLAAGVLQSCGVGAPLFGRGWAHPDPLRWPVELLPELRSLDRGGGASPRVFNDMIFGGFLIFYTPQLPVFIDDRCELYGTPFLMDYVRLQRTSPEEVEALRQQYGFGYALVQRGSLLEEYLRCAPQWHIVRAAAAAALYRHAGDLEEASRRENPRCAEIPP